ncbi:MAG: hypothetical protein KAS88_05400 [Deltaproteobacteria bacterium]|nr:hypothetical protein [Deltaproteobacteria bacterium]
MAEGKFALVVNCMDGRVQAPVREYLCERFNVDYVDVITEAGPCKSISDNKDTEWLKALRAKIEFLAEKHGSKDMAIVGHFDCGANASLKDAQHEQILASVKVVESWGLGLSVIGLWVGDDWQATEVLG